MQTRLYVDWNTRRIYTPQEWADNLAVAVTDFINKDTDGIENSLWNDFLNENYTAADIFEADEQLRDEMRAGYRERVLNDYIMPALYDCAQLDIALSEDGAATAIAETSLN